MAPTVEDYVDAALDKYLDAMRGARGVDPEGVTAKTLARLARVSRQRMSGWLQDYRMRQGHQPTRYVIAGTGYGLRARWRILARPGSDPQVMQEARREQAIWSTRDMARRFAKDVVHEIKPGLKGKPFDEAIDAVLPLIEHQLIGVVEHVERALADGTR